MKSVPSSKEQQLETCSSLQYDMESVETFAHVM